MKMFGTNSPTQQILRNSEFLSHSHIPGISIAEFKITLQSSKNDISSQKEKNYKDSTLNKSNRTLFCYRTIYEASKFTENDDGVEKNGSHILS